MVNMLEALEVLIRDELGDGYKMERDSCRDFITVRLSADTDDSGSTGCYMGFADEKTGLLKVIAPFSGVVEFTLAEDGSVARAVAEVRRLLADQRRR